MNTPMFFLKHALFALILFLISALISRFMVKRVKVLDVPNARSSHGSSTPTLGGIAIVASFVIGSALVWLFDDSAIIRSTPYLGFSTSVMILAAVSLYDDLKELSFKIRLAAQALAAVIAIFSGLTLPGFFGALLSFFWIMGMVNAVNFMDGLNGMAGGNGLVAALYFSFICLAHQSSPAWIISYFIAAGTAGFLIYNFPRGRLFMGDVGSTFLGFSFAALGLMAHAGDTSVVPLMVMPLLFFHFIYDTVFTMSRRFRRGENIFQAHRSHLYQLFNQLGFSHPIVTGIYCAMAILQGLGALWLSGSPGFKGIIILIPYLSLQLVYTHQVISRADKKGLLKN